MTLGKVTTVLRFVLFSTLAVTLIVVLTFVVLLAIDSQRKVQGERGLTVDQFGFSARLVHKGGPIEIPHGTTATLGMVHTGDRPGQESWGLFSYIVQPDGTLAFMTPNGKISPVIFWMPVGDYKCALIQTGPSGQTSRTDFQYEIDVGQTEYVIDLGENFEPLTE